MDNRDIDRQVAEKVMGWKTERTPIWNDVSHFLENDNCWITGNFPIPVKDWHPSTSWNDAWQVIEKMREKSLWLSLWQIPSKNPEWNARFSFGGMYSGNRIWGEGYHLTAPLAICKAALKAIGD